MQAVSATVMKLPLRTIIACLSMFTLFSTTGEAGPGVFYLATQVTCARLTKAASRAASPEQS